MRTASLLTAEEFLHLPRPIDGGRTELTCGKVVTMSPVGRPHSTTARRLLAALGTFVDAHGNGELHIELGFILSRNPDTVRAPDVAFIDSELLERAGEWQGYFEGAPSLAIEVRSPDDRDRDVERKVREYLDAGSARVWDVRPDARTVTVHGLPGGTATLGIGQMLSSADAGFSEPGFELPVAELFS